MELQIDSAGCGLAGGAGWEDLRAKSEVRPVQVAGVGVHGQTFRARNGEVDEDLYPRAVAQVGSLDTRRGSFRPVHLNTYNNKLL